MDGVDEVPSQKREVLAREIESLVGAYPLNYWIISTRPGAVHSGWMAKLNFLEARIQPMSLADQDEFIDKWYSAVSSELRSTIRRAENLPKIASSLKQELRDTPNIARLAIYPLLCAMVCALYRERNQKLPETQAAVCEDLCKMLLHRRERETPDLSLVHLPTDYRKLDYEHKKYIMAELAKFMVDRGISSISEAEADALISTALQHFPDHAQAHPAEMRKAFIERSGLLRPAGTDRIDFLHNTLKEYLAAGRFVVEQQFKLLARRAIDDAWQPVILFAAALPTPGFASKLVSELLGKLPKTRTENSMRRRAAEFFLVRCRNAAFRLEPQLVEKIDKIASGLFPPKTIADAEVLANLGEIVVPHLNPKQQSNARQTVACIRALRLIGGPKAKAMLKIFIPGKAKSVLVELFGAAADLEIKLKLPLNSLDLSGTSISDLTPLAASSSLHRLNLSNTRVENVAPLSRLRGLQYIDLTYTEVSDLSPLSGLSNLRALDLLGNWIDLRSLNGLRGLRSLRLAPKALTYREWRMISWFSRFSESFENVLFEPEFSRRVVSIYARLALPRDYEHRKKYTARIWRSLQKSADLAELDHFKPYISMLSYLDRYLYFPRLDLSILKRLTQKPYQFERLIYYERQNLAAVLSFANVADEFLSRTESTQYDSLLLPLAALKNLRHLSVAGLLTLDFSPLSRLKRLEILQLNENVASDLTPLGSLRELRWLELSGSPASDFSHLSKLNKLRILDMSNTDPSDLTFLTGMKSLETLNLANTQISDLGPLLSLGSLKYLIVSPDGSQAGFKQQLRQLQMKNRELQIIRTRRQKTFLRVKSSH